MLDAGGPEFLVGGASPMPLVLMAAKVSMYRSAPEARSFSFGITDLLSTFTPRPRS
ncbi:MULTISPECIES: hypothetical protein [unclassified Streptomyces]|uniref:hypothetical protein n=1 Tax=unclassified Streptomyces TaxID=2593676 RepID=UPI000ACEF6E2|nr:MULTISPECIES: hypothetical protein [unclassified Streptomyces]